MPTTTRSKGQQQPSLEQMPAVTNHPKTQQSIMNESKAKNKPQSATPPRQNGKKSASQIVNETKPPPENKDNTEEPEGKQPTESNPRKRKAIPDTDAPAQDQDRSDTQADEKKEIAEGHRKQPRKQTTSNKPLVKGKRSQMARKASAEAQSTDGTERSDDNNADDTKVAEDSKPSEESKPPKASTSPPTQPGNKARGQPRAQPRAPSARKSPAASVDLIAQQNGADTQNDTTPAASTTQNHRTITINRAPVLHLWAACVAMTVRQEMGWETALSAGAAVAGLCAVSKGRALGMIGGGKEDDGEDGEGGEGEKKKQEKMAGLSKLDLMGFQLPIKNGLIHLSGKPKPPGTTSLQSKYGGESGLEEAKKTFMEAAGTWKGDEETLQKKAFGFYEKFRPGVDAGTAGWGRNGVLDLDNVLKIAGKEGVRGGQKKIEDMVE